MTHPGRKKPEVLKIVDRGHDIGVVKVEGFFDVGVTVRRVGVTFKCAV